MAKFDSFGLAFFIGAGNGRHDGLCITDFIGNHINLLCKLATDAEAGFFDHDNEVAIHFVHQLNGRIGHKAEVHELFL